VPVNPNPFIAPGLTLQQYAYNTRTLARAYSSIPPYLLGYNPYQRYSSPYYPPATSYNPYAAAYGASALTAGAVTNPYMGNPYLATTPGSIAGPSLSTTPGTTSPAYDPSLTTSPYYGNPYDSGYGTLRGLADLTNAAGNYEVTNMKAKLMGEELTRARLETKRRIDEEARRERNAYIPDMVAIRTKELETAVNLARRDPPLSEVISGRSLNDMLVHLASMQGKGYRGPSVRLDDLDLDHINVAPDGQPGNVGLVKNLKPGEKLNWAPGLRGEQFKDAREKLDQRLTAVVTALRGGALVHEHTMRDLEEGVKKLEDTLEESQNAIGLNDFIVAKRYLNQLKDALRAMKREDAYKFFNGDWTAKPKGVTNVAEMINYMKDKGLRFAPAVSGDEGAYRALLSALVTYDANLAPLAASK